MNSKRFFFVMIALVVLLIAGFGGGAYQANKMLQQEGDKLVDLKLTDRVLRKQQSDLQQAKKYIEDYSELETVTKSIVPQEKDQAKTIGEIAGLANRAGIQLGIIQFPESELGRVTGKGNAKKPVSTNDTTQLTPLEDLKGVYSMTIDISNHSLSPVRYDQIISYLDLLEGNRRTAQVTDISIRPDQEQPSLFHFTIKLNTYIRPE